MATPKVFISSTCYDLKYIRENLKYFVKTIGYEPILSEEGSVFYDPKLHTHEACIAEIPNCQMFVLIIGGRYGAEFKDSDKSITNVEYRKAIELKIPIFSLVEQTVLSDHYLYTKNKNNTNVDEKKIYYPSVDNCKIFDFIDEVRLYSINNALVPFKDFGDIEEFLRKQWAGMMFSFLTRESENSRVEDNLNMLKSFNARIEMLSRQILKSVGTDMAKLTAKLYDKMLSSECIRDLAFIGLNPTPASILQNDNYEKLALSLGKEIGIKKKEMDDEEYDYSVSGTGEFSKERYDYNIKKYEELREELMNILTKDEISIKDYLESSES